MTPPALEVSDRSSRAARAGVAMSVAVLAMALGSGIQAVLYLSRFGTTERTDAFFGAFALYTVFGVFTQAIRITSVPLLVGPGRMRPRHFATTLGVIALPVLVVCLALAGPLAHALAPGVSAAARALTVDGVRILGVAMVLQLGAAGAATLLAVWDRFEMIAGGYIAGAAAGLVAYFVAVAPAGELALGWSMLAMAIVTFGWMALGVRQAWRPGEEAPSTGWSIPIAKATVILGRTLVYFVLNGLFLVTLAYASHKNPGDATVFSYAYLFASYLVAGTGLAVGISRVPAMSEGVQRGWHDVLADTVPSGFRYGMLVAAPAMAGLVAAGASLIGDLFPEQLPASDVHTLQTFGALLMAWVVAALFVNFILPALFALGRARMVNLLSIPMVALHVLATIAGERLFGLDGIVGAMFLAPLVFALTLLAVAGGSRRAKTLAATARDAVEFPALAAVAFGLAAALVTPLPEGVGTALLIAAIGSVVYLLGLRLAAPRQLAVLLSARRRAASA